MREVERRERTLDRRKKDERVEDAPCISSVAAAAVVEVGTELEGSEESKKTSSNVGGSVGVRR
jgi:hypothetical protein